MIRFFSIIFHYDKARTTATVQISLAVELYFTFADIWRSIRLYSPIQPGARHSSFSLRINYVIVLVVLFTHTDTGFKEYTSAATSDGKIDSFRARRSNVEFPFGIFFQFVCVQTFLGE
jgi:hypothetical protein